MRIPLPFDTQLPFVPWSVQLWSPAHTHAVEKALSSESKRTLGNPRQFAAPQGPHPDPIVKLGADRRAERRGLTASTRPRRRSGAEWGAQGQIEPLARQRPNC